MMPTAGIVRHAVDEAFELVKAIIKQRKDHQRLLGQALIKAKEQCPHGEWIPRLKTAGISPRTAQWHMEIAVSNAQCDFLEEPEVLDDKDTSGDSQDEPIAHLEHNKPPETGQIGDAETYLAERPPIESAKDPEPPKDEIDQLVPPGLIPVFERAQEFQDIINQCNAINRKLKELAEHPAGALVRGQQWELELNNLKRLVRFDAPYCVCPMCHGIAKTRKANCACKQRGWLNKGSYENLPTEYRS